MRFKFCSAGEKRLIAAINWMLRTFASDEYQSWLNVTVGLGLAELDRRAEEEAQP